jgi:hypothetical protein
LQIGVERDHDLPARVIERRDHRRRLPEVSAQANQLQPRLSLRVRQELLPGFVA